MTYLERRVNGYGYAAALTLLALVFFGRSLSNYFVCDDFQFLDRINFSNAAEYLTKSWGYGNEYRPFLPYTYALDASISGTSPVGYHITNVLLHVGSSVLVAGLTCLIGLSRRIAALAGVIYLLNPVAHEPVLWIAGRPVVLAAFLMLACCYLFLTALRRPKPSPWRWVSVYVLFLLALGTYELAIVTPVLAGFLAYLAKHERRAYQNHLLSLLIIAGVYALFWNWFFEFHFTRIKIEHSWWRIALNFADAVSHSFHGSRRLEVAPFYLLAVASLWKTRQGRWLSVFAAVWFVIGYLPYFAVTGYADRFAYLSSSATAVLLAAAVLSFSRNSIQRAAIVLLLGFFGVGMQNRITAWKEAGVIAETIPLDIKKELPVFPTDREVVLLNVPLMHKRSYVYLTSLDRALERQYPGGRIHFKTAVDESIDDRAIIFEYSGGHMIRRTFSEVSTH